VIRWKRWLWLGPISVVGVLALAALCGFTYERIARARDAERFPAPGRLIDVGGFKLHLYCTGEGGPTVILDTGLGVPSPTWAVVQTAVSRTTRTCSYDRAGYGWSDAGPKPRTSPTIVAELYTLLDKAGEHAPFVLVGHSFGGYNVRLFAHEHRDAVAGLVLVDSSHEDQVARMPPGMRSVQERLGMLLTALRAASAVGLMRVLPAQTFGVLEAQAPSAAEQTRALSLMPQDGAADEAAHFAESAAAVRAARDLGSIPLIVLTARETTATPGVSPEDVAEFQRLWVGELQPDLARLSTRGEQRIVGDSSHMIPILRPDAVVDAIESVVRIVREGEHQ
jgi:pimeloyl-ACP methyl ester carboxylesterase